MDKKDVSPETIKRLTIYVRCLESIRKKDIDIISSKGVDVRLNIPHTQFRKDLSYFGEFGKRGVGYDVEKLIDTIKNILGLDKEIKVVVIGAGRLGSALIGYPGFSELNINIAGVFDKSSDKIGTYIENIKVLSMTDIGRFLKKEKISISLLTVPADEAQNVAEILVKAGIKGILNFAPATLVLPKEIYVSNVDMASELGNLIFRLKK